MRGLQQPVSPSRRRSTLVQPLLSSRGTEARSPVSAAGLGKRGKADHQRSSRSSMWSTRGRSMSPGPSHQAEQKDRLAVLKNEQAQHEPTTYHSLANLNVDTSVSSGRVGKDYVAGSELAVQYPAASGPWADPVRVPDEPPLGYPIDAQEPVGTFAEISLSAAGASAVAGKVGGAPSVPSPADVVAPPASSISRASTSPVGDGNGVGPNQSIVRSPVPNLIHRPVRRL